MRRRRDPWGSIVPGGSGGTDIKPGRSVGVRRILAGSGRIEHGDGVAIRGGAMLPRCAARCVPHCRRYSVEERDPAAADAGRSRCVQRRRRSTKERDSGAADAGRACCIPRRRRCSREESEPGAADAGRASPGGVL